MSHSHDITPADFFNKQHISKDSLVLTQPILLRGNREARINSAVCMEHIISVVRGRKRFNVLMCCLALRNTSARVSRY